MVRRGELKDEAWDRIAPLLPERTGGAANSGRTTAWS